MRPPNFRIGSVPYLNSLPLTCGLEGEVLFAPPSQLAALLAADALDAALVSVTEVLRTDRYDALDGLAIGSHGPVRSVLLAHRVPLADMRTVHCDPASLTSVALLKVLLGEQGLKPTFKPLPSYRAAEELDAVLLIGDQALDFALAHPARPCWDFGQAWRDLTGLPFVYAVWALRRGAHDAVSRHKLREAGRRGLAELDRLGAQHPRYPREFVRRYLAENVRFELGDAEKAGLQRFGELVQRHGPETVYPVRFVA